MAYFLVLILIVRWLVPEVQDQVARITLGAVTWTAFDVLTGCYGLWRATCP